MARRCINSVISGSFTLVRSCINPNHDLLFDRSEDTELLLCKDQTSHSMWDFILMSLASCSRWASKNLFILIYIPSSCSPPAQVLVWLGYFTWVHGFNLHPTSACQSLTVSGSAFGFSFRAGIYSMFVYRQHLMNPELCFLSCLWCMIALHWEILMTKAILLWYANCFKTLSVL